MANRTAFSSVHGGLRREPLLHGNLGGINLGANVNGGVRLRIDKDIEDGGVIAGISGVKSYTFSIKSTFQRANPSQTRATGI